MSRHEQVQEAPRAKASPPTCRSPGHGGGPRRLFRLDNVPAIPRPFPDYGEYEPSSPTRALRGTRRRRSSPSGAATTPRRPEPMDAAAANAHARACGTAMARHMCPRRHRLREAPRRHADRARADQAPFHGFFLLPRGQRHLQRFARGPSTPRLTPHAPQQPGAATTRRAAWRDRDHGAVAPRLRPPFSSCGQLPQQGRARTVRTALRAPSAPQPPMRTRAPSAS